MARMAEAPTDPIAIIAHGISELGVYRDDDAGKSVTLPADGFRRRARQSGPKRNIV